MTLVKWINRKRRRRRNLIEKNLKFDPSWIYRHIEPEEESEVLDTILKDDRFKITFTIREYAKKRPKGKDRSKGLLRLLRLWIRLKGTDDTRLYEEYVKAALLTCRKRKYLWCPKCPKGQQPDSIDDVCDKCDDTFHVFKDKKGLVWRVYTLAVQEVSMLFVAEWLELILLDDLLALLSIELIDDNVAGGETLLLFCKTMNGNGNLETELSRELVEMATTKLGAIGVNEWRDFNRSHAVGEFILLEFLHIVMQNREAIAAYHQAITAEQKKQKAKQKEEEKDKQDEANRSPYWAVIGSEMAISYPDKFRSINGGSVINYVP